MLRLIRPLLKALDLGLGLVLLRFAYLLLAQCLRASLLYLEGLVVLRDHCNRVYGVDTIGVPEEIRLAAF